MDGVADSALDACTLARTLRDVLTGLGDALVAHDLDAMLAAEPRLADASSALARLAGCRSLPPEAQQDLTLARLALGRCRRLGDTLDSLFASTMVAQGRTPEYVRRGRSAPAGPGPVVTARA